ncbi:MAG: MarR family winged helix-turn-helix transcriptional regulator [Candidatus Lokiarchaeota archaeon]
MVQYDNELLTPLQFKLLRFLRKNGKCVRSKLQKYLNYPRTTIYDNLEKLEKRNLVERFHYSDCSYRGRPKTYWKITQKGLGNYD